MITVISRARLALATTALLLGLGPAAAGRPFEVDDLFRPEQVGNVALGGPVAFSRDGRRLAIVRVRPRSGSARLRGAAFDDLGRSDIWIQPAPGAPLVNLTDGARDDSGSWSPIWSPDGERLGFVSTRGGHPSLWMWNAADGSVSRISARGPLFTDGQPFAWLDGRRLLYAAQPLQWDEASSEAEESLHNVERGWRQAIAGSEPSADVQAETNNARASQLLLVGLDGNSAVLAEGISPIWRPSPTGSAAAWVAVETRDASAPSFGIAGIGRVVPPLTGPLPAQVVQGCLSWSRDSGRLAVIGRDRSGRLGLYIATLATGRVAEVPLADLWVGSCLSGGMSWSSGNGVLFRAKRRADVEASSYQSARNDWWYVKGREAAVNLTSGMTETPRRLFPATGGDGFIGSAGGEVWRIAPERHAIVNLTRDLADPVRDIAWPAFFTSNDSGPVAGCDYPEVLASLADGRLARLDTASGRSAPFALDGRLVAYAPASRSALTLSEGSAGLAMARIAADGGPAQALFRANAYLREIEPGRWQRIDYRSTRGEALVGWLLLPPDYRAGRRYPLISWVYPERVYGASPPSGSSIEDGDLFNFQVAAGRGYAVLFPSMPLGPYGVPEDPLARLQEGVMPAVDVAVSAGFADPDRLFVMGHSFGGFAVNGLVGQTDRFRAAVSIAGASDLISAFGTRSGELRYRDAHHDSSVVPLPDVIETGQFRMQAPPWRDPQRYVRNSPIFAVDHVRTPLLLIHGDLDYVPIQQSEEFYSALVRLGARAEFVRYLGEGHSPRSPANIRDMWRRVLAWFDRYGRIDRDAQGAMIWEGPVVRSTRHGS